MYYIKPDNQMTKESGNKTPCLLGRPHDQKDGENAYKRNTDNRTARQSNPKSVFQFTPNPAAFDHI